MEKDLEQRTKRFALAVRAEIHTVTSEQRLEWLCQAASFVYEFKGRANSKRSDRSDRST